MAKVEIVNNASPIKAEAAVEADSSPKTISFELEAGGEAVFRIPTVRDMKAIEKRKEKYSLTDTCRELGALCLVSWGDLGSMPDEDDIDAADDQTLVRLFLRQLAGVEDASLDDQALMDIYLGEGGAADYEVTSERSHHVSLSCGDLTLRRLTRKDIRRIEANAEKTGAVTGDVMTAVSVTVGWWRSDRPIMPADFDGIPLAEFRKVSAALQGFLKSSRP